LGLLIKGEHGQNGEIFSNIVMNLNYEMSETRLGRVQSVFKKDRTFTIKTLFYNILSTVPFKVVPSTGDTPFPTFLPLLESWNALSVMARSSLIAFSWISACSKKDRTF
jgi:hypothetical protein